MITPEYICENDSDRDSARTRYRPTVTAVRALRGSESASGGFQFINGLMNEFRVYVEKSNIMTGRNPWSILSVTDSEEPEDEEPIVDEIPTVNSGE